MEKTWKFNYVYVTTNLLDGKKYIGDHSTNKLNDGYLGSGIILKEAIKNHGRKNFKKEILVFFDTKKEAFDTQERLINEYNTLNPNGYNISPKGGLNVSECMSDDIKKKIGNSNRGKKRSKENRKKISDSNKGKIRDAEARKNYKNAFLGRKYSKDTKKKMSMSATGRKISDDIKRKISEKNKGKQPNLGNHHTDETKEKISFKTSGNKNPMYGKTLMDIWTKKYGEEKAIELEKNRNQKLKKYYNEKREN